MISLSLYNSYIESEETSMTTEQHQCEVLIHKAFETASAHYGKRMESPTIRWSNRMTKCAGTARFRNLQTVRGPEVEYVDITLATKLLALNGRTFIEDTPEHEAAHVIAVMLYGWDMGKGHGKAWHEVMEVLGKKAERLHRMQVVPT
jgi:predicted SprT family Zn-dependent metalloprotease